MGYSILSKLNLVYVLKNNEKLLKLSLTERTKNINFWKHYFLEAIISGLNRIKEINKNCWLLLNRFSIPLSLIKNTKCHPKIVEIVNLTILQTFFKHCEIVSLVTFANSLWTKIVEFVYLETLQTHFEPNK